ncbi:MAG: glycosyltransferase [Myxococcus sp.]|nr:glycosyltransferase [Myxococcus sp.]
MARAPLLYLTQDGLLEPLSHSQVVRVVEGLARKGWRYRIVSLEKEKDLADSRRVSALRARLADVGVQWDFEAFDWSQSSLAAGRNLGTLVSRAVELARAEKVSAIHARAYVPAVAALAAWNATGLPWIFDARGFWIDERLEEGRWFTTPLRLGIARGLEHQLFTTASGVVTLTELQAREVEERFRPLGRRSVACITTTADYTDFVRRPTSALKRVPAELVDRLSKKRVISIIGSINRSYLVDETIDLARRILAKSRQAHLLVLSAQRDEYARRLTALGVPLERVTITRAEHDAMPEWLSLVEWCLLVLNPSSPAKRASMPTKLGELFASGVRPIQYGCNDEVSDWVRRAGTGLVLASVESAELERAAEFVAESATLDERSFARARNVTAGHFSLAAGVEKYHRLLAQVLAIG